MFKYTFYTRTDCHEQYKIAKGKNGNGIYLRRTIVCLSHDYLLHSQ